MMLFFFIVAGAHEKFHPKIGHETSYTVILGIVISLILWFSTPNSNISGHFKFNSNFFLNFMLPPLIFNSGYTMHKRKFFENLGNISIFGLCTTIVCFIIYGVGGIALINIGIPMTNYYLDSESQTI